MDDAVSGACPAQVPRSLVVVDDCVFISDRGQVRPHMGDFYRFALRLGERAGIVTFCSPLFGAEALRRGQKITVFGGQAELVPTFPYRRVADYVRRLPAALLHNLPVFARATRAGDLVLIRLPAANGPLAFCLAAAQRKPVVLFLVGNPACGALATARTGWRRTAIRLAARLEWFAISRMARHAPTFAYGSDLSRRLQASGARQVSVTFTSLVDVIPEIDRDEAGERGRQITVLYVGRFVPEKCVDRLIDAAKLCADAGVPLRVVLAGDGPLAASLHRHPAVLAGLDVEFTGWLEDGPQLHKVFREADVYVQPSRAEGIPKVLVRAMAYGLPIVATEAGGIPDVVTDGKQGLLVPVGSTRGMADALVRLAADPSLRHRLGKAGREFARDHTTDKQADAVWRQIVRFYPRLARPGEG